MGFIIIGAGEIRLVGRDQRQPLGIGQIDQSRLDASFGVDAMTLQLDIEPVAEQLRQPLAALRGEIGMVERQRLRDRPVRTTGQRDHALGLALEPIKLDVRRLIDRRFQKRPRIELHQAEIAGFARRQQHDPRRRRRQRGAGIGIDVAEIDREFAADDRLDAITRELFGKLQRAEHIVGVGQRQRRLVIRLGKLGQLLDLDRAFQQRIGRMDMQVNETGRRHDAATIRQAGTKTRSGHQRAPRGATQWRGAPRLGTWMVRRRRGRCLAFPQPLPARSKRASSVGGQARMPRTGPVPQRCTRSQGRAMRPDSGPSSCRNLN